MSLTSLLTELLNLCGVHGDLQTFLQLLFLLFARLVIALALAPFLGGQALPQQVRVALALLTAMLLYPTVAGRYVMTPQSSLFYVALLVKELVIGTIIGFISQMIFFGVAVAGIVIDTQRGLNQITYLAPQLPGNTSALGNLQVQASVALFLMLGGHLLFLRSLALSFLKIPPMQIPHLAGGWLPLADEFARISATAIQVGANLCAPVVLTIFLVDISFGSVQKVAASIRISNDTNTAKSLIGLGVLILSAGFFWERLQQFLLTTVPRIDSFLRLFQFG